jgi:hypothetical protein
MADYMSILTALFGTGNVFLLSFILGCAVFGAIKGIRGEVLKMFIFLAIIGLSFLTTKFVTIVTILIFSFYYGKKIYKGIQRT